MSLHTTDFSPLDHGTQPSRRGIIRCLVWLPVALLAVSITVLGMIIAVPWVLVAWIVTGKR
jgi:membrane protein required for beta-lactamase induction